MSKYVITGGPGFEKTTIIESLGTNKFYIGEEIARKLIKEVKARNGHELPNKDRLAFETLLLEKKIKDYSASKDKDAFFDRGLCDAIGFFNYDGITPLEACIESCNNYRYDKIFLVPPWEEIYVQDNERPYTFQESSEIHEKIKEAYIEFGYNPIEVPRMSVKKRVEFVLRNI
tara:strand:- start:868 stop:1386 length:519 start_codon:yes stop_codon:yes gene_type:complete